MRAYEILRESEHKTDHTDAELGNIKDLSAEFPQDLKPGEVDDISGDYKSRDISAIDNRIKNLRNSMHATNALSKYPELAIPFKELESQFRRKVELSKKMRDRPTASGKKLTDMLEKECSEFIGYMKQSGSFLYRGTGYITTKKFDANGKIEKISDPNKPYDYTATVFTSKPFESRQVMTSSNEMQELFDKMLKKLDPNWKALRSNSIFTTTNESFARSFGKGPIYLIFPKNGFEFLSTSERDLVISGITQFIPYNHNSSPTPTDEANATLKQFFEGFSDWAREETDGKQNYPDWGYSNIKDSLEYDNYISAFQYLLKKLKENSRLPPEHQIKFPEKYTSLSLEDVIKPEWFKESFHPTNDKNDFVFAMESGKELLIHGEYIAVLKDTFRDNLAAHFFTTSS